MSVVERKALSRLVSSMTRSQAVAPSSPPTTSRVIITHMLSGTLPKLSLGLY